MRWRSDNAPAPNRHPCQSRNADSTQAPSCSRSKVSARTPNDLAAQIRARPTPPPLLRNTRSRACREREQPSGAGIALPPASRSPSNPTRSMGGVGGPRRAVAAINNIGGVGSDDCCDRAAINVAGSRRASRERTRCGEPRECERPLICGIRWQTNTSSRVIYS